MLAGRLFAAVALTAAVAVLHPEPASAQRATPGIVTVSSLKGSATLSWKGIGDASISYRVLKADDPKKTGVDLTKPLPYNVTVFTDPASVPGVVVFYTVVAVYSDGYESPSDPVQFPPTAAPMPTASAPLRGATLAAPLQLAGPMPLRAMGSVTAVGPYTQVTLSWPPVLTAAASSITYVVRRVQTDPATLPPNAPLGYVTGAPVLAPDGRMTIVDWNADLHLSTWYLVVASSTTQGSVNFPWLRRDPPAHRGVDTVSGSYWRVVQASGSKSIISWGGCAVASAVPGAAMYGARLRVGAGNWINIAMRPPNMSGFAVAGRRMGFDTQNGMASLLPAFETGATPQVQMWPVYSTGSPMNGPFVSDTLHLQPVVYKFQQVAAPLVYPNCS